MQEKVANFFKDKKIWNVIYACPKGFPYISLG
jgi:hypothetical protein